MLYKIKIFNRLGSNKKSEVRKCWLHLHKAIDYHKYRNTPRRTITTAYLYISEYKLVKIQLSEIEYIESLEDYIKIHITGAKPVITLLSMKKVLENCPLINFNYIAVILYLLLKLNPFKTGKYNYRLV